MVLLALPASICYAGSFARWRPLVAQGWSFWRELPFRYRAERARHPRLAPVRKLVDFGATAAGFVLKQGGLLPLAALFFRILATEGPRGLRGRYRQTVVPPTVVRSGGGPAAANRILVADYRVPRPEVSAGDLTTLRILRDLRSFGYEVVFLPADLAPSPEHTAGLEELGVTVVSPGRGVASPAEYVAREGHGFALFYLIRLNVAELLLPLAREAAEHAAVVFHAPDLACLREERQARLARSTLAAAEVTRRRELDVIAGSDAVVVLSDVEKEMLEGLGCTTPIELFPALYAPLADVPPPFAARRDIFFLGGFTHAPNVDAVVRFAESVWPDMRAELPGVSFHIIGAEATRQIRSLAKIPGVVVDGFVPDLVPVLAGLRLGVAPLRFGAGLKGKVALTMGAGIPCVCTPIAAEGMGLSGDLAPLLVGDEKELADRIVRLYGDEARWTVLSRAGQAHVRERFGEDACRRRLETIVKEFCPFAQNELQKFPPSLGRHARPR